jgi:hypothetical protein
VLSLSVVFYGMVDLIFETWLISKNIIMEVVNAFIVTIHYFIESQKMVF